MKRESWLILLAVVLGAVVCGCIVVACAIGVFAYSYTFSLNSAVTSQPTVSLPPTSTPIITLETPTPLEEEAPELVVQAEIPPRDLLDLAYRLGRVAERPEWRAPDRPPGYELGDQASFWVFDEGNDAYFSASATLRYETPHAYWWVEDGFDIPQRDLKRSATRFEDQTYPSNHRYFGTEWTPGVDGDPHVYIFLGNVPGVGAYYSPPDEYPTAVSPYSNEHEMFYVNLANALPGDDYFDGILAHEFQHMIHWSVDRNEDSWVNEGLSELAAQLNGYDVGGSDLYYIDSPDTQLTTWPDLADSAPHYGASYLFLAFFYERYGEDAVRRLVSEPANGIAGFEAVLAHEDPARPDFGTLFADWVAANYLDGQRGGHLGYADLLVEQPLHAAVHDSYPVEARAQVRQFGADYILLEGRGDLTVEFTGSLTVPLVGNRLRSGEYQWWSNRGDDGDATLTRAFDLTGLEEATLEAWTWYDLEPDYDYGYVEVSANGGVTWTLLANEHTTTSNPNGSNYGPAFTGLSGGGETAEWVLQTFDLTPFAGREVLVRFEVITDESVNHPGLCLDGVSIPELGYSDDAEEEDSGWSAAGWVRVADDLPQEFLVQLISVGREVGVDTVALDRNGRATIRIAGLGERLDRAVLAVSGLTRVTTEPAGYTYRIYKP